MRFNLSLFVRGSVCDNKNTLVPETKGKWLFLATEDTVSSSIYLFLAKKSKNACIVVIKLLFESKKNNGEKNAPNIQQ